MTPTDQLKDLLAKVTPGPWVTEPGSKSYHCCFMDSIYVKTGPGEYDYDLIGETFADSSHDATLIALAPTLAAEVVRLRIVADAFEELLATVEGECPSLVNEDSGAGQVLLNLLWEARQALDCTSAK